MAQPIGLDQTRLQFALNGQRHLKGHRVDGLDEQRADGLVDAGARHALADRLGAFDAAALADVVRPGLALAVVILNGHALAAAPAQHQPLQQGSSLAWRPAAPISTHGLGTLVQARLVALEGLPRDVAGMDAGDQRHPLVARHAPQPRVAIDGALRMATSIDEGAGVPGVVQRPQHLAVVDAVPHKLALVRPLGAAPWEGQLFHARGPDRSAR